MDAAHLHLMVNHVPVLGTIIVALLLGWGLIKGSRELMRTAFGAAVIVALLSYPVFLTGGRAEDRVGDMPWATERLIENHEEQAEIALVVMLATGVLAGAALWFSRRGRPVPKTAAGGVVAALAVSAGLFGWAALSGGVIRHDEIRSAAMAAAAAGEPGTARPGRGGDD